MRRKAVTCESEVQKISELGPWVKSKFPGVRYRKSRTRKYGVRFDQYFSIRYKINGKDKEEGVGWLSGGITEKKAFDLVSKIKDNIRLGAGVTSLAEMRALAETEREVPIIKEATQNNKTISFSAFWEHDYWPRAQETKSKHWLENEKQLYNSWIRKPLGKLPLSDITLDRIEPIVSRMLKAKRAVQTIQHVLKVIRQVWNYAKLRGLVSGETPTRFVKLPKSDNKRIRFLTKEEAGDLLKELEHRSQLMHDYAVISLFAGLRAGEISKLRWCDINFDAGTLSLRDTKSGKTRYALITPEIKTVLLPRYTIEHTADALVFPAGKGSIRANITKAYTRAVEDLGLNNGISDRRQRVVFHTLRHTFASWLVQRGVPLYTVAQLMGHSSIEMTKRYSHLAPDNMRAAAMLLSGVLASV